MSLKRFCTFFVLLCGAVLTALAQQIQVKGTVLDKKLGETIIGASVVELGTDSNGTITDFDGHFTLSVNSGATLQVSYVGYKTLTVKAAPSLQIEMEEDSQMLGEVVVTGYQVQRKADLTGA
ncbi:MAG: carboxypeptidase-like regulatory domain-containing protein, partial [Bacteroides sp.]